MSDKVKEERALKAQQLLEEQWAVLQDWHKESHREKRDLVALPKPPTSAKVKKEETQRYVGSFHRHFAQGSNGKTLHAILRNCDFPGAGKAKDFSLAKVKVDLDRNDQNYCMAPSHFKESPDVLTVIFSACNDPTFGTCRLVCKKWLTAADDVEGKTRMESTFIALAMKNWLNTNGVYPVAMCPIPSPGFQQLDFIKAAKKKDPRDGGNFIPVAHGTDEGCLASIAEYGLLPSGCPILAPEDPRAQSETVDAQKKSLTFVQESHHPDGYYSDREETDQRLKPFKVHLLTNYLKSYSHLVGHETAKVDLHKQALQEYYLEHRQRRKQKPYFGVVNTTVDPTRTPGDSHSIKIICVARAPTVESGGKVETSGWDNFYLNPSLLVPVMAVRTLPVHAPHELDPATLGGYYGAYNSDYEYDHFGIVPVVKKEGNRWIPGDEEKEPAGHYETVKGEADGLYGVDGGYETVEGFDNTVYRHTHPFFPVFGDKDNSASSRYIPIPMVAPDLASLRTEAFGEGERGLRKVLRAVCPGSRRDEDQRFSHLFSVHFAPTVLNTDSDSDP